MSNTKDTSGPAFPNPHYVNHKGMTLRDYFAAKALQGLLADSAVQAKTDEFASRAYDLADAMLEYRSKEQ